MTIARGAVIGVSIFAAVVLVIGSLTVVIEWLTATTGADRQVVGLLTLGVVASAAIGGLLGSESKRTTDRSDYP